MLGDERPADIVAVYARQVPVQHDDVVAGDGKMFERVGPVEGDVDRQTLSAQSGPDRRGQDLDDLQRPALSMRPSRWISADPGAGGTGPRIPVRG